MNLFLAILVGLGVSIGVERWLAPCAPGWRRPWPAWFIHLGIWLLVFAAILLLVQRPWFAMLLVSAFIVLMVAISNAKFRSLAEPFTLQDFRYLTDAIRYPRLYLPYLGWKKALVAIFGVSLAFAVGFLVEPAVSGGSLSIAIAVLWLVMGALLLLVVGGRHLPAPTLNPVKDIADLGLLGSLWAYGQGLKDLPEWASGFGGLIESSTLLKQRPHLVAVQSESFFDPRGLLQGIRPEVLAAFDLAKDKARGFGALSVPALGANTVRSEFAFLAGLDESSLGAHKFNPYESVYRGVRGDWQPETFPILLKRLGYRTICIHPYDSGFYRRDRVFPLMGIDEFIDLGSFGGALRAGHYVSDAAVTDKILEVVLAATVPTFVFVITMENHGPLHLENVSPDEIGAFHEHVPPVGFEDLTAYLRHLKNADRMVERLITAFDRMRNPVSLCWYGDHVPIMPGVYDRLQRWPRHSEYLVWDNPAIRANQRGDLSHRDRESLSLDRLASLWLGQSLTQ